MNSFYSHISIVIIAVIVASCSTMLIEPAEIEASKLAESSVLTKGGTENEMKTARQRAIVVQTSPITLLLNSVVRTDSTYVLALSEEKARSMGVSKKDYELAEGYVVLLNELEK